MQYFDEAWLRTAYDALRAMFAIDQHTRNAMIEFLYDEGFWDREKLQWDAAIARFNANLNPNKPEAWKIGELWALAIRFDRPQLFSAVMDSLGFESRHKPTEERRQDLLQRVADVLERLDHEMAAARAELLRLDRPEEPRRPQPLQQPRPQFSLLDETTRNLP